MSLPRHNPGPLCAVTIRLVVGLALVAFGLAVCSATSLAQSAANTTNEGCGCHSDETESWQSSPHGRASADMSGTAIPTCEGCHGPYVRGHPEDGTMSLTMDSSVCTKCHAGTYAQWQDTMHASAGVQCIGCHLTHSQQLRLTGSELCGSCHQDSPTDAFHLSHRYSDVLCTECHVAPEEEHGVRNVFVAETTRPEAPSHDFTDVNAANCIECHSAQVRENETFGTNDETLTELMAIANRVPELRSKLDTMEEENRVLVSVTYTALGLGIGVGVVLGMILALFAGYKSQRES